MTTFAADVRDRGGVAILKLSGLLDGQADATLNGAYEVASRTDAAAVVLDFADVSYINSTGIALVVGLLAKARTRPLDVLVCGLSEHYRHIFEITRLADFMRFFADEDAAVLGATPTV